MKGHESGVLGAVRLIVGWATHAALLYLGSACARIAERNSWHALVLARSSVALVRLNELTRFLVDATMFSGSDGSAAPERATAAC